MDDFFLTMDTFLAFKTLKNLRKLTTFSIMLFEDDLRNLVEYANILEEMKSFCFLETFEFEFFEERTTELLAKFLRVIINNGLKQLIFPLNWPEIWDHFYCDEFPTEKSIQIVQRSDVTLGCFDEKILDEFRACDSHNWDAI